MNSSGHVAAGDNRSKTVGAPLRRRVLLVLCFVGAALGSWALFERLMPNKLPAELLGKWVVQGGEQDGATFDFYRNGTMVGRVNVQGREGIINASVRVEDNVLFATTVNPHTKAEDSTILRLDAAELVLEDDRGQRLRMQRAE
jgi:uncharacterized protein (TIGR03066 family)